MIRRYLYRASLNWGVRLSRLGERRQIEWLVYNPLIVRWYHRRAVHSAPAVVRAFERVFPEARRYADIGAGSGAFAAHAQERGHPVQACEYGSLPRWLARRQGVDCRPFDLTMEPPSDLDGTADLVYCFEVAEHVPEVLARRLVRFVAAQAPKAVFTAAPPGQGGTGHVNEQPRSYWIDLFEREGMTYRPDTTQQTADAFRAEGTPESPWLAQNVMIFEREAGMGHDMGQAATRLRHP